MEKSRQLWIDAVKLLACGLVALGHLLQSFVKSGIISESILLSSFDKSIYSFHVPLFFVCSGYLYQNFSRVVSFSSWKKHAEKKLVSLGVPYVVFVIATWIIKRMLTDDVNSPVGSLFDCLLIHPIMQYWYLYCLFLLFVLIPTAQSLGASMVFLLIATAVKCLSLFFTPTLFAVSTVMQNAFWFVLGMFLCITRCNESLKEKGSAYIGVGCIFVFLCISFFGSQHWSAYINFLAGLIACVGVICTLGYWCETAKNTKWIQVLSKYTMPIYLMHTIFAAAGRIFLLKLGITNWGIHLTIGLLFSFAVPIVAAEIMMHTKYLSWILRPSIKS